MYERISTSKRSPLFSSDQAFLGINGAFKGWKFLETINARILTISIDFSTFTNFPMDNCRAIIRYRDLSCSLVFPGSNLFWIDCHLDIERLQQLFSTRLFFRQREGSSPTRNKEIPISSSLSSAGVKNDPFLGFWYKSIL
jgi:hypothetical protein